MMRSLGILSVLLFVVVGFWWFVYLAGLTEFILIGSVFTVAGVLALDHIRASRSRQDG